MLISVVIAGCGDDDRNGATTGTALETSLRDRYVSVLAASQSDSVPNDTEILDTSCTPPSDEGRNWTCVIATQAYAGFEPSRIPIPETEFRYDVTLQDDGCWRAISEQGKTIESFTPKQRRQIENGGGFESARLQGCLGRADRRDNAQSARPASCGDLPRDGATPLRVQATIIDCTDARDIAKRVARVDTPEFGGCVDPKADQLELVEPCEQSGFTCTSGPATESDATISVTCRGGRGEITFEL
ncbi:MAG: hypothetical protein ACR2LK_07910 [Solirubrobacteraceae bacterium]